MKTLPRLISAKAPPIKSQGIKTKITPVLCRSVKWDGRGRWVEPFVGSGSVLFNVQPERAYVADTNKHLINFYKSVQRGDVNPDSVAKFLKEEGAKLLESQGDYYYEVRQRFNENAAPLDFLFLSRACFNGIMRFNSKGGFNVPFCRKPDRFRQAQITKIVNQVAWIQKIMESKDWVFHVQDWRETLAQIEEEDFVYLDPPYIGRHADYHNKWEDSDAEALASAIKGLSCGFAYSMWKKNKYRINPHIDQFEAYPMVSLSHFYHVGAREELRNAMEEVIIVAHKNAAFDFPDDVLKAKIA